MEREGGEEAEIILYRASALRRPQNAGRAQETESQRARREEERSLRVSVQTAGNRATPVTSGTCSWLQYARIHLEKIA